MIELALIAVAAVLALMVTYSFFVQTTTGQELDHAAFAGSEHEPQGLTSEAWELLDTISVGALAVATVAIAAVAVLRKRPALALAAMAMIGISTVSTEVLKKVVLERPDLIGEGVRNTLPSGHVTVAAGIAVGMVMVTAPRWRPVVGPFVFLYPVAIGVAVVAAGWHRPSDVVAAWAVVIGSGAACLAVVVAVAGFDRAERAPRWFRISALTALGTAIVLLGGLGALGMVALREQLRDGVVTARWEAVAYVSSVAGITAIALVALVTMLVMLRGLAIGERRRQS